MSRNKEYKDFKNYIHNDCGISKSEMVDMFRNILVETIQNEVQKFLNDNERVISIAEYESKKEISRIIQQHPILSSYNRKHTLENSVADFYDEVYKKLKENILDNVEISFKGSDKSE